MKYIYLNEKFYNDFPKDIYPELEIKKERPYIQIVIEINNIMFALPLRSNISHQYVYYSDKENKCGIDYSKAVVINEGYIDKEKIPQIRQKEFNKLKGKDRIIYNQFIKYIKKYKIAKNKIDRHSVQLVKFSSLQYFEHSIIAI